jgi:hypothetical protein
MPLPILVDVECQCPSCLGGLTQQGLKFVGVGKGGQRKIERLTWKAPHLAAWLFEPDDDPI